MGIFDFFTKKKKTKQNDDINLDHYMKVASIQTINKLEELFNYPVNFNDFNKITVGVNELPMLIGKEDEKAICVIINVNQSISGKMIFMVSEESGKSIYGLLEEDMNKFFDKDGVLTERAQSCLQSVASIFISSFVSSISNFLGEKILVSIPSISHSFKYSIINEIVFDKIIDSENLHFYSAKFSIDQESVEGLFLFMPDDFKYFEFIEEIK